MSSSQITVPADTWVQITTTDKEGSIYHQKGIHRVSYTESPAQPQSFDGDTPVSGHSYIGESLDYYGIAQNDFLWAYAIGGDVVLTLSPKGV